jgi:hypothetical protein
MKAGKKLLLESKSGEISFQPALAIGLQSSRHARWRRRRNRIQRLLHLITRQHRGGESSADSRIPRDSFHPKVIGGRGMRLNSGQKRRKKESSDAKKERNEYKWISYLFEQLLAGLIYRAGQERRQMERRDDNGCAKKLKKRSAMCSHSIFHFSISSSLVSLSAGAIESSS